MSGKIQQPVNRKMTPGKIECKNDTWRLREVFIKYGDLTPDYEDSRYME